MFRNAPCSLGYPARPPDQKERYPFPRGKKINKVAWRNALLPKAILVLSAEKKGFTLIELLIVVAIIAILAAIAVPNFLEAQTRSKVSRVKADMRTVRTGLEAYHVDYNHYPPNLEDAAGRANVMHMPMGDMPFVPYTLSTPVSYLSAVPFDHFKPLVMKGHTHSFMYYNSTNVPSEENRAAYRALVEGRIPATARVQAPKWFLTSVGPDLVMGTIGEEIERRGDLPIYQIKLLPPARFGSPVQYDPSNGTVSEGDVVLYGP